MIEDNPANLKLMVFILTKFGHEALGVREGQEGVEKARHEKPDLILLDIHMPRMDGYEVVRLIREDPQCGEIPVVAVTALAMVGDREKILTSSFTGYISKPIDPEAFPAQVQGYLGVTHGAVKYPAVDSQQGELTAPRVRGKKFAVVLIVDNSQSNLDLLRITLGGSGYEVLTAHTVREGFDLGRRTKPDLILSDLHMPHEDGFTFLRLVQIDPELSKVPFVFLSSSLWTLKDQERALGQGARKFLSRPIEPQMLLEQLKEYIPKPTTSGAAATSHGVPRALGEQE